jgi:transposase
MTNIGRCLTAKGVKPIVRYQHAFKNTYLYGAFSPIDGDAFVYEIEGTTSEIFYKYIKQLSLHRPEEFKIVVIDNAGFHSVQNYDIPENIKRIRIPPYTPELNPSEKIWAHIKQHYKNKVFDHFLQLKEWLSEFIVKNMNPEIVKSITHHPVYMQIYKASFMV